MSDVDPETPAVIAVSVPVHKPWRDFMSGWGVAIMGGLVVVMIVITLITVVSHTSNVKEIHNLTRDFNVVCSYFHVTWCPTLPHPTPLPVGGYGAHYHP